MGKHGTTRLTATHRIVLPAATAAVLLGLSAPVAVADDATADATSSDQWPGMRSDAVKKVLFTDNDNGDINVAFIGNKITNAGNKEGGGVNIAILPRSNTGNCSASAA